MKTKDKACCLDCSCEVIIDKKTGKKSFMCDAKTCADKCANCDCDCCEHCICTKNRNFKKSKEYQGGSCVKCDEIFTDLFF